MEQDGISGGGGSRDNTVGSVQKAFNPGRYDGIGRLAFKIDISSGYIFRYIILSIPKH
jgi:hypothetical protein